jgi:hypothetical protein
MAINKNFVVKNGFEASTDLILANADTRKVGIGTTNPEYTLHVNGGIGATDSFVSGISTVLNELRVGTGGTIFSVIAGPAGVGQSVGIGTASPAFLLDIRSPVSTGQTAVYIQGDVVITGDLSVDDITFDDATLSNLTVTEALNVTSPGISTFGGYVDINSDVDISGTLNVVGLSTFGGYVDINNSVDISNDLNVSGIGTIVTFNSTTGTITNLTNTNLNVTGIATIATLIATGVAVTNFTVYNNLSVAGIGTLGSLSIGSTQVISSARELQNIVTLDATTTATIEAAIANAPNTFTDLTVTGISTLGTVKVSSGIITATSGIVTYFGDGSNLTGIATGLTATIGISSSGAVIGTGITTVNVIGIGFTADASGTTANLYLPAPGVSLGLAIALGG